MTTPVHFPIKALKTQISQIRQTADSIQWETHYAGKPGKQTYRVNGKLEPRQQRSIVIQISRLYHVANLVAQAYQDQLKRTNGPPLQLLSKYPHRALCSKYLPTLLSIASHTSEHNIQLCHWFRAQFDLLRPPPGCVNIPLTVTHGLNAHTRYLDWFQRQHTRFTHSDDRATALDQKFSKYLTQQISHSHQFVLQQLSSSAGLATISLELALWDLYPNVSPWYLVAHEGFRQGFLVTQACIAPHVVKAFLQYQRDPAIREICNRAMLSVTDTFGELPCILSHSEQV